MSIAPRVLYRRLYRELSFQSLEASEKQNSHEDKRKKTLEEYKKRAKAGVSNNPDALNREIEENNGSGASRRMKLGPLYNSTALREIFLNSKPEDLEYGNEVLQYLKAQRTYKLLLDRYNPGATMEDDERIRLSARRVGLALPDRK